MKKLFLTATVLTVVVSFFSTPVYAYVMQSANYRVQFDSVNSGGGLGTSPSYKIEDSVGQTSSGISTSTSFNLYAGYQQMEGGTNTTISLKIPTAVNLQPSISGLNGGVATSSADIVVSTNNSQGYSVEVAADTLPALKSGLNSFADYSESSPVTPDFTWSVLPTDSAFGFTVEGDSVYQNFLDDGSICNSGFGNSSDKCWAPFSTTPNIFAFLATPSLSGSTTTLKIKAESGSHHVQPSGDYSANLTITAYVN